jgi:hypothetical protein
MSRKFSTDLSQIKSKMSGRKPTFRLDNAHHFEDINAIRVVVHTPSKEATATDLASYLSDKFQGTKPVNLSFREHSVSKTHRTFSGFIVEQPQTKPATKAELASLKQLSIDMYVDEADQSLWRLDGSNIIKASTVSLAELANVRSEPLYQDESLCLCSVRDDYGAHNMQMISFLDSSGNVECAAIGR